MNDEHKKEEIERIYNEAMEKLKSLQVQQKGIIDQYLKELEQNKQDALKDQLSNIYKQNS